MSGDSRVLDADHYALLDLDEERHIVGAQLYTFGDIGADVPPVAMWTAAGYYSQGLSGGRYFLAEPDRREDDQTRRLLDEQEVEIVEKRGVWHVAFEGLDKCASGRRGCGYATRLAALDHAVCVAQEYEEWRI